ncbi:MAG: methyltransferase domain-containing protein [Kordiimonadaceae bacterium]|mgnify:CR=1|jgi:tRNA1(Val) A37 N6-methylase TrmN6|nr:methyltransferase domain-containing protein [Kordiimonadaceae bacterium]MBT6037197.1 methyltransferase domain-containing protein [Kordiimonadaceae bacterium]MBT6329734.1 methyltransferase domain-containing protein [Kordiimonadaceae bacterium]
MTEASYSNDDFLGGRITFKQPKKGYRITSDSVFLSATVSIKSGERILDMGAGSGGLLSLIAARLGETLSDCTLHGIEIQPELISLARENALSGISYFEGDILNDVEGCEPNSYHHVISNPPYYEKNKVSPSPHKTKAVAHGNEMIDLKIWIERMIRMVRPKGHLTLVHRADRLDDILSVLTGKTGSITVYPFYSKAENDANRVIIRAQKDAKGLLCLKSGLIVHTSDGNYTETAEDILRHAHFLDITK